MKITRDILILAVGVALSVSMPQSLAQDAVPVTTTNPPQPPVITHQATAKRLLGRHLFSLQWVSWKKFGSAHVTKRNGLFHIKGEQRQHNSDNPADPDDFVRIDGIITQIDKDGFTFEGRITTRIHHIAEGRECTRDGIQHFRTKSGRKYWRMMEIDNPCDNVADYVDVYFSDGLNVLPRTTNR